MGTPDASARTTMYLEDLSAGQSFTAGPYTVTESEIIAFAKAYDPQVFHLDPEAAKHTFFNGLAASGWHTAAITMKLQVQGAMPLAGGAIGLGGDLSWPRPTRPGDALTVTTEVIEITPSRSKPHQAIVTMRTTTRNQNGEPVQFFTAKVMAFARGHSPEKLIP